MHWGRLWAQANALTHPEADPDSLEPEWQRLFDDRP